ncbi:MAG: hypothetical protein JRJ58_22340 [Deltaproteobacteria bacterium]|nr:hypothetical protein [Deltaproteobacteria bacterium]
MKNSRRDRNQSLDSLLDTMANVVGILVVVLAFTQLQVGEAVRRIHDSEVARIRTAGETMAFAGEGALREVSRLEASLRAGAESAAFVQGELRQLESQSEKLRAATRFPGVEQADIVAAILRETATEREMLDQLSALRANRKQLEIRLRGSQDAFASATHQIRLPDPRPAPAGTEERVFFCRYGRVSPVDLEHLHELLNIDLRKAAGSPLGGGLAVSLVVSHFEKYDVGDRDYRWRLQDHAGFEIAARLQFRRESIGELPSELIADDSGYRRALSQAEPKSHYLRFYVWSDSFAAYLRAREIAEELGFAVGWQAYDREAEHEAILQANVLRDAIPID